MSSAGGIGSIDDDVLSEGIKCYSALIENLNNKDNDLEAQNMINEIKVKMEDEGILEEDDALIFHTDNRISVRVTLSASNLKDNIYNYELIE
ncbi:MAG: hypothetical protein EZS28_018267 [Streblomastix strix]|uniref:Uncharacterized protein n=1 Tax=Streblomastix strix TaxID=222440 RepID=A0A5J4VUC4_9EUKA|nr:MAG: hypothetical protein EZS28_018267 [Streblomastix strix]